MSIRDRAGVGRRPAKFVLTVMSATLLAGCAVGPDYETPKTRLPGSWANASASTIEKPPELGRWWVKLNDHQLNTYIDRAIAGNLDVASAKARVREARAILRQEIGGLFPSAQGDASLRRTHTPATPAAAGQASTFTQSRVGFDASWELDLFGGRARMVEAARYGLNAAAEELRNTMLVLIGDVASNYSQVRASQARLALARRTAKSQRETAALTKSKFEAGSATIGDVSNAEGLAATTEADIATYEIQRATAVHRLGILLGQPPAELSGQLAKVVAIPRPRFPLPVGIPADTLLSRPDVRVAERELAQSTARIGAAEAARYPAVSLTGNIASQALSVSDLATKSTIGWAIGPAVTVPLFRGGQLQAAADLARARRDQSFAAYESTVLKAMEDVENAIVSLTQQRNRTGKLASAASSYRAAANAARNQFELGSTDYLDLLDAQRALYSSEAGLIDSQLAVVTSYIALNKALGGGWNAAVDTSTPLVSGESNGPHLRKINVFADD